MYSAVVFGSGAETPDGASINDDGSAMLSHTVPSMGGLTHSSIWPIDDTSFISCNANATSAHSYAYEVCQTNLEDDKTQYSFSGNGKW